MFAITQHLKYFTVRPRGGPTAAPNQTWDFYHEQAYALTGKGLQDFWGQRQDPDLYIYEDKLKLDASVGHMIDWVKFAEWAPQKGDRRYHQKWLLSALQRMI